MEIFCYQEWTALSRMKSIHRLVTTVRVKNVIQNLTKRKTKNVRRNKIKNAATEKTESRDNYIYIQNKSIILVERAY